MRFSVRVNNDLPADELFRLATTAQEHGFDQLWVSNDLLLRSAPALVGALAVRTSTLQLGIGVVNPYSVHPAELAMAAATLQELSGGRFLLGVGAGSAEFLSWAGIPRPEPLARTRSAVAALRALLGHRDVDAGDLPDWYKSQSRLRWDVDRPVPVYVGAMGPRMLRMAGEVADGALPLLYPPERFRTAVDAVQAGRTAATHAGGTARPFDLPACFWVSVSGDGTAGRDALAEKLAYYGPSISPVLLADAGLTPEDFLPAAALAQSGRPAARLVDDRMLALGIAGDPAAVVARCRALQERGATHLSFGPPLGPDPVAALALLGREVLPALRAVTDPRPESAGSRHG
ncbi:LLM class flavin-dependent oxidoreductase [Nakamurella endophytica]|uniref:5,10-methylenetetrahydromethanopterin reductase n=1 Tax=Nakamurella endophytica TaxID=1748367 RepID=A0A917WLX0_9ACTN|nr:LLM class flavin-dependent oxidoreductase [Nakamurella endophytica]GGM13950.1 5,10-methylenetetrahydromethanopterin reductase [Nakamurella endophytica]